jgi:hypothetical protein
LMLSRFWLKFTTSHSERAFVLALFLEKPERFLLLFVARLH